MRKQCQITCTSELYSCFEKGCWKKCTWQSQKVLWVVFGSLVFKEISRNGTRGHGRMFGRAKGKQQILSKFDSYSFQDTSVLIISHITFWDCRVHSFCHNLSQNSCIWWRVDFLVEISLVVRWFGGKITVTCGPSRFMVISPPNHLANNKIATKKLTCHLWITLKQLTQFNT